MAALDTALVGMITPEGRDADRPRHVRPKLIPATSAAALRTGHRHLEMIPGYDISPQPEKSVRQDLRPRVMAGCSAPGRGASPVGAYECPSQEGGCHAGWVAELPLRN